MKTEVEMTATQPQARDHWSRQKVEKAKGSSLGPSGTAQSCLPCLPPPCLWTSGLQDCEGACSCYFKNTMFVVLVTAATGN